MDDILLKRVRLLVSVGIGVLLLLFLLIFFNYTLPIVAKILALLPVILMPFILAIIIALLIEPVVDFLENRLHLSRSMAAALSLGATITGLLSLLAVLLSVIIREMADLYKIAVNYSDQIVEQVMDFIADFRLFYLQLNLPPQVRASVQTAIEGNIELAKEILEKSINLLVKLIGFMPGIFILMVIATVASYFIIRDRALIRNFLLGALPPSIRLKTRSLVGELFNALIGFLKAYSILILITTIITLVALRILGINYVFTIGLLVGLLDIIPILGPGALFIPWVLYHFISGNTAMAISLLTVYLFLSIVRQFLEPKIVGDNIGLHPLATLISLYVGLQLGGIAGMIIVPGLVVLVIALYHTGIIKPLNWRTKE